MNKEIALLFWVILSYQLQERAWTRVKWQEAPENNLI